MQIIFLIFIISCFLFIGYLFIDNIRFNKKMKNDYEKFFSGLNDRVDLLSRENARVKQENDFLRDKLKNMGFTEEQLKH